MVKLTHLLIQKFLPSTKKSVLVRFRKKNGAWTDILLPPNRNSFKTKGDDTVYYVKGVPDIEDSTNQRTYNFLHGIPYPISMTEEHPKVLEQFNQQGNLGMMLTEADQEGYDRAMLVKKKPKFDMALWTLLIVGLNLLISLGIIAMVMGMAG